MIDRSVIRLGLSLLFLCVSPQFVRAQLKSSAVVQREEAVFAVEQGLRILVRGAQNFPSYADCFSCHHQAMPMFALSACSNVINTDRAIGKSSLDVMESIGKFTLDSMSPHWDDLVEGKPIDGRALTTGYAHWTLKMGEFLPRSRMQHELRLNTKGMLNAIELHLATTQSDDGGWDYHSFRPPASSSRAMATAFSVLALKQVTRMSEGGLSGPGGQNGQNPDVIWNAETKSKIQDWLANRLQESSNEDRNGRIWCESLLIDGAKDETKMVELQERIWAQQKSDGGWAQEPGMASDAYATGQSLVILAELNYHDPSHHEKKSLTKSLRFKRGVRYLLDSQKQEGAWHVASRVEPIKEFFDNGDPFGKDQFISMMATGWATVAIASHIDRRDRPPLSSNYSGYKGKKGW
jgi:N-acyl-D-amino-acid deacylase